ncbi:1,2-phenylacetyl-CoA epoxidase subunit PaaE [Branchiibius sp. NY16-3462-2]|uniref:1,2-phenylacetyl-CoA epoxidase subunit PaaE n=1 Tax=Branchiibius sp. NY16-3462-2 TaxID=1807500 RepID=UPI000799A8C9|nr:1,2-phenylacetyl-CoA epoxidase subunit PaaE [Branchiibius sp. NY16-3462-2]KYH45124.1 phenylacetic acid degradation protein [Branchiibius sp. NY16-3462-2]
MATFHELSVAKVERLTDDAVAVTFEVPDELRGDFDFGAGQSLTLRRRSDGTEHRRSYSICAPAGSAPRVGVREIPGGGMFSTWLTREVRVGDRVEVGTPSGRFRADPTAGGRHLCIAAGSGITPMLSVAATVLTHPDAQVTLLYGNRTSGSVMFAEEIADLKDRYPARFEVVHVLSREPRSVDLFSGRLDADRLRQLLALQPMDDVDDVWLCGPFGMISDAREVLEEIGFPSERVHFELFYVDEPPPEVHRPEASLDGAVSQVTVTLDGRATQIPMSREHSILDGAAASRSDVPFACKGGVCGTCRAIVRCGEVDMRRNYALDDAEVDAGFVLTCQTYPVSDEVSVDFDA